MSLGTESGVVLERLFEASLDGNKWPAALRSMADAVGGTACGVRFESITSPSVSQIWTGLEPDFERAYVEHYWADDIWAVKAREQAVPGMVAPSDAIIGAVTRQKNAFINELCTPFELDDLVGGLISLSPEQMVSFAAMKPRGRRPFDDGHAQVINSFLPHVRRALMVERALRDAREGERTAWSLVDRLSVGAIVLDARRRVIHQNAAATRMLNAGVSLDSRPMRELVTNLRPCRVHAAGRWFAAVALRLPEEEIAFGLASATGRTLVLVTDPLERVLPPLELLMSVYGLTLAEARVALLVGKGHAPKEVASELGTAWNTVRAQLRHVFAKTHTSGQPGLVRLLVQLGIAQV